MGVQEFETEEGMNNVFEEIMEAEQANAAQKEREDRIANTDITALLSWSLDVYCPCCDEEIDLASEDFEGVDKAIFNNKWDDLKGYEVECPDCKYKFKIDSVEH